MKKTVKKNKNRVKEQLLFWKKSDKLNRYLWIINGILAVCLGFYIFHTIITDKNAVAIVNGERITIQDLKTKIADSPEFYQEYATPQQALDDYITEKILLQKAKRFSRLYRKDIKKKVKEYSNQLLIEEFLTTQVMEKAEISSDDIKAYYNAHLNDFFLPERIHLYEIVVPTQQEAENILKRLSLGENFSDIAKKESIDSTKDNGGDMGVINKGKLYPDLESLVFQLNEGNVLNKFIKTGEGFHIIKIGEKYPSQIQTFEQASPSIKQILVNQQKKQIVDNYLNQLREKEKIEIFPEKLKKL